MSLPDKPGAPPEGSSRGARELEARIAHEWEALKALYEERLKDLQQRGLAMVQEGELASRAAQYALDRLQSRLLVLEEGLGRHLARVNEASVSPPTAESLLASIESSDPEEDPGRGGWFLAGLGVIVLVLLAAIGYLGFRLAEVNQRAEDAERRVNEVAEASAREWSSRMAVEGVSAAALKRAMDGQRQVQVLSSPDLVRTPLEGGVRTPAARGLVLWSPSSGVVVSGIGVVAPQDGRRYVAWMVTAGRVYRLGVAAPESDGRVSAVFDPLPVGARAVRAFIVTEEADENAATPSQVVVLTSP